VSFGGKAGGEFNRYSPSDRRRDKASGRTHNAQGCILCGQASPDKSTETRTKRLGRSIKRRKGSEWTHSVGGEKRLMGYRNPEGTERGQRPGWQKIKGGGVE